MCRRPLQKDKRCYFIATVGDICYNLQSLQNVKIFDINQQKGGKRKYKGKVSHVLIAQKPLKKLGLNTPGLRIKGTGEIYKYYREDGSYDYSFKVGNASVVN